jgi:predicted metal-binding transcription factor (methanogenesis marker protein 9)
VATFTEKLILNSFKATGISPFNADVILDRFTNDDSNTSVLSESSTSVYSGKDWLKIESLIRTVAEDLSSKESRKVLRSLHHLSNQNELLHHELQGVKEALTAKKKQGKKQKTLPLQQREEYHGGSVFWSPRKRQEAEVRYEVFQRLEMEEQLAKAEKKQLRANNKLVKEKLKEEKRVAREAAKVVREKEKATQVAENERQRQARDAAKAIRLPQKDKHKALWPSTQQKKRQKSVVDAVDGAEAVVAPPAPPRFTTRCGRNVNLPKRFE